MPGRVRRALDGGVESQQRYGDTLKVAKDGRLETNVARGGGLKVTRQGLMVDMEVVGEKNRPMLDAQTDLDTATATAADIAGALNNLYATLRKTGNMRGFGT